MGLGIDPSQAGFMNSDGLITSGGYSTRNRREGNGNPAISPRNLFNASSGLAEIGSKIIEANKKLGDPNISDEEKKKIQESIEKNKAEFDKRQKEYIGQLDAYLKTDKFGGNGIDGLVDLYEFMNENDKSGLDNMELSDSIAKAARGTVINGKVSVNEIQNEILKRVGQRQQEREFDEPSDYEMWKQKYREMGIDPDNFDLNAIASPQDRFGQILRMRENGAEWNRGINKDPRLQTKYFSGKVETSPEEKARDLIDNNQYNLDIIGRKGAMPPINKASVTNPALRGYSGGWGERLKKKEPEIND